MKTKLLFILLLVSGSSFAGISAYEGCIYILLGNSCVISGDAKAPKFMIEQGAASCFVGDDLTRMENPDLGKLYVHQIKNNSLDRSNYASLIKKTHECVSDPDMLVDCSFANIMRFQDIEQCKPFLNQPKLHLVKTPHGLKSDAYELELGSDWKLVDEIINQDRRSFVFEKSDKYKILLTVSNAVPKSKLEEYKAKLREGIDALYKPDDIEKISYQKLTVGTHPDSDELVLYRNNQVPATFAQYYIYGKNRVAILTYTILGEHRDIALEAQPIAKSLIWK